ncbi:MAG: SWIM zinc finger family protein, partial [Acetobacteraceae bacterium]|nr:SWIM zinc finger family protein [Acetobacteraceae bacterium]
MQLGQSGLPRIALREVDLGRAISPATIAAGRSYARNHAVSNVVIDGDGTRIEAQTQGSARRPYHQNIRLQHLPDGHVMIRGMCSCPVGLNCKHVAAVLITTLEGPTLAPSPILRPLIVESLPEKARDLLPSDLASWLSDLENAEQAESEEYPDSIRQRMLYVFSADHGNYSTPVLRITPTAAYLRKDGSFSQTRSYAWDPAVAPPQFLRTSDKVILARLHRWRRDEASDDVAHTLRRIVQTGRACWDTPDGPTLTIGPERPGRIAWRLGEDGSQHAALEVDAPAAAALLHDPWYFEAETGVVGPLKVEMPLAIARRLLRGPSVPLDQAERFRAEIGRRLPSLPQPSALPEPEPVEAPLRPHLRLFYESLPFHYGYWASSYVKPDERIPLAELRFQYGPLLLPLRDRRDVHVRQGRLLRIQRDTKEQIAATNRLMELGFRRVTDVYGSTVRGSLSDALVQQTPEDWLDTVLHHVPILRKEGWTIEIADDFPIRIARPDGDFTAELTEGSGIDWLELHLGVLVDGQRLDLAPALIQMITAADSAGLSMAANLESIEESEPFLVPLPDGRLLSLSAGRVRPILLALIELFAGGVIDPDEPAIRFTRLDAADVAALEEASGLVWQGGESLRALGKTLREAGGAVPQAVVPESFRGSLRPYQSRGVDWLQFLRGAGLGGILADDMGLGKTVQTLAHVMIEKAEGRLDQPALIVCPTSLVWNWLNEAARFAPTLNVLALHGPARKDRFSEIRQADLVITTYPLLTRDKSVLTEHEWHVVVLDEAQTIKNPNAATTRLARQLQAR